MEEPNSADTSNRKQDTKTWENDFRNKQLVSSTIEQLQTTEEEIFEKKVPSENAKTLKYEENYATNKLSPSQPENYPASRFVELRNPMYNQRNSALKRTPFREINGNDNKQLIWRPW